MEFLSALVAHLREEYAVPADRVFAAGFSNGGQMVIRLVMQAPDLISGAAVISSNHPTPENVLPEMAELDRHQPMPMVTINGTRDPIVPFGGGISSLWGAAPRGPVLSSAASAALFAARNGITEPAISTRVTHEPMATTLTQWRHEGRAEEGQDNVPETAPPACSIDPRGVDRLVRQVLERHQNHQRDQREGLPDMNRCKHEKRAWNTGEEHGRLVDDASIHHPDPGKSPPRVEQPLKH